MLSSPAHPTLDEQLQLQGWSFHQRLAWASSDSNAALHEAGSEAVLQAWRQVVAPDSPGNFEKRLSWDGLTVQQAGWAFHPDPAQGLQPQDWWPLLGPCASPPAMALIRRVWRIAAARPFCSHLAACGPLGSAEPQNALCRSGARIATEG